MKADYVHKDTLTATDYVELNKNNELLISYNQALLKENQELKKQLEEKNKPQIFIDTQDIEERYAEELYRDFLKEENQELKKKLEEKENIACDWKDSCLENAGKIEILETQQKDFIKYLELEKDCFVRRCSNVYEDGLGRTRLVNEDIFDEIDNILQKYKEIIGE